MNKLENETIVTDDNKSNHNNIHHIRQEQERIQIPNNNNQHKQHHQQQHNQNFTYNVNLKFEPQIPTAGRTTRLEINITEQKAGNIIKNFETIHDKLMHLIVISEDLSYFEHVHPTLDSNHGVFSINHTFPEAGNYKLWIDFKPKGGIQTLVAFKFNVSGNPIHKPIPIENNRQYTKTVDGKYQITLKFQKKLKQMMMSILLLA